MSDRASVAMRADDFPLELLLLQIEDIADHQDQGNDIFRHQTNNHADRDLKLPAEDDTLLEDWSSMSPSHQMPSLHSSMSPSPADASSPFDFSPTPPEPIFQFDLQQLPCNSGGSTFPTPSMTPNNTPSHTPSYTPSVTPDSSNPGSPRGSTYGGDRDWDRVSRKSPTAKLRMTESQASGQKIPRHKRESHINAEKRRRGKIQSGFEEIHHVVPSLKDMMQSGSKESKAAMLGKTIDHCRSLRSENKEIDREAAKLRAEIEGLTSQIKVYQEQLPVSGMTVHQTAAPLDLDTCFQDYVRARTCTNWKFWIFGLIIRPLFTSFNRVVSTNSVQEFCSTTKKWLEKHCSLLALRPAVLNTLRLLSKKTTIMVTPERLPQEALQAVMEPDSLTDDSQGGATS